MKRYFVIKLAYDNGFWSEEDQDFVGWMHVTRYYAKPKHYFNDLGEPCVNNILYQLEIASTKKPVTVMEVYDNE